MPASPTHVARPRPDATDFVGVDLGGGKGRTTAVAHLRRTAGGVEVIDYGTGRDGPWWDERLIEYLRSDGARPGVVVAVDAPLTLPACVRCALPQCPGHLRCEVPELAWLRARAPSADAGEKPRYTAYTQRITEVLLHEDLGILPRETLGQGMGPLTARAAYLRRALADTHALDHNLIEVYPKATVLRLFPGRLGRQYKRSAESPRARLAILEGLTELRFALGAWREHALTNDHKFDAILCAYTAYLWADGRCLPRPTDVPSEDGWLWTPG